MDLNRAKMSGKRKRKDISAMSKPQHRRFSWCRRG